MAKASGRSAGQLIERGDRTWLVRIYIGRDDNGKRKYHNKTIKGTKRDAQRYLSKVLREMDTGEFVEPSRQTVAEYLKEWLEKAASTRLRPATLENYRYRIDKYIIPQLGDKRLSNLTPLDVQSLYTFMQAPKDAPDPDDRGLGLSARSVRIVHNILHSALKQAVRWRMIPRNPASDVELPTERRSEMQHLTPEQAAAFLDAAEDDKWFPLWCVLLTGGLRPSEALGLKWEDLDEDRLRVRRSLVRLTGGGWHLTEPKTRGSRRTVPLPSFAVKALRDHRKQQAEAQLAAGAEWEDNGLIFASEFGRPLHHRNLAQRHFEKILERADLPRMRMYDLRHSAATLRLANGEHPKVVAELLGHASVTLTLDTYSHVVPGMQEAATARLDSLLSEARAAHSAKTRTQLAHK